MKELVFSARREDFRVDTFASGGPGGQHQNKAQSGVRIVHLPTGLSAESRETRSQYQNKRLAFKRLADLIVRYYTARVRPPISNVTIRTYHEPDNRVKDHASGLVQSYREVVDDERIDDMVTARKRAL